MQSPNDITNTNADWPVTKGLTMHTLESYEICVRFLHQGFAALDRRDLNQADDFRIQVGRLIERTSAKDCPLRNGYLALSRAIHVKRDGGAE